MYPYLCMYIWARDGSWAGVYPHVIWRVPPKSEKQKRDEGLLQFQNHIDYLNKNTSLYRTRAERNFYMSTVVNANFIGNTAAAQALYEFITGNVLPKSSFGSEALATTRFALNCQDHDIIVDMRKLNARVNNELFDPFWAKMAMVVEGRVNDRRHGEYDV